MYEIYRRSASNVVSKPFLLLLATTTRQSLQVHFGGEKQSGKKEHNTGTVIRCYNDSICGLIVSVVLYRPVCSNSCVHIVRQKQKSSCREDQLKSFIHLTTP